MNRIIRVLKIGKIRYAAGLKLQEYIVKLIKNDVRTNSDQINGILILTEHYPVYTVGIRDKYYDANCEKKLCDIGAEFYKTNRGGLITFHGPGQLVSYPILNLNKFQPSVRWYVSQLEKSVISTCKEFDLDAYTSPHTGVWVNDKKICAVGIHVSQYITSHGLALNCDTDLSWFKHIVPCGIKDKEVTSLSNECAKKISIESTTDYFLKCFASQFDCVIEECSTNFVNDTRLKLLEVSTR